MDRGVLGSQLAHVAKLRHLVVRAERDPAQPVGVSSLLQRRVVELSQPVEDLAHRGVLAPCGVEPVAVDADHRSQNCSDADPLPTGRRRNRAAIGDCTMVDPRLPGGEAGACGSWVNHAHLRRNERPDFEDGSPVEDRGDKVSRHVPVLALHRRNGPAHRVHGPLTARRIAEAVERHGVRERLDGSLVNALASFSSSRSRSRSS